MIGFVAYGECCVALNFLACPAEQACHATARPNVSRRGKIRVRQILFRQSHVFLSSGCQNPFRCITVEQMQKHVKRGIASSRQARIAGKPSSTFLPGRLYQPIRRHTGRQPETGKARLPTPREVSAAAMTKILIGNAKPVFSFPQQAQS